MGEIILCITSPFNKIPRLCSRNFMTIQSNNYFLLQQFSLHVDHSQGDSIICIKKQYGINLG